MARILVAEDDKNTNKLICAVLRRAGHEPLPAFDGQDALDVLDKNHVDLLVSDVMMPRMSGFELTRALRDTGYDLPILMLTAKQGQEALREGFLARHRRLPHQTRRYERAGAASGGAFCGGRARAREECSS